MNQPITARVGKLLLLVLCITVLLSSCGKSKENGTSSSLISSDTSSASSQVSSLPASSSEVSSDVSSEVSSSTSSTPEPVQSGVSGARYSPMSVAVDNPDINQKMLETSFLAEGNLARIAKVLDKAERGEKLVIGFLGGSITEGMAASIPANRYSSRVVAWFQKTYPQASFELVNAGIGSTGSIIAGGRMEEDLLSKKPDMIFIDFAVNDGTSDLEAESYEGVVYRALTAEKQPAVMLLFMTRSDGGNSESTQVPVGTKFVLPMISYRNAIAVGIGEKRFTWTDMSPDNVHPSNRGHALLASLITHRLELVRKNLSSISRNVPALAQVKSRFTAQTLYNSQNFTPQFLGSFQPATGQYQNLSLSKGWTAKAPGDAFTFETTSKVVTLVYKKQVLTRGAKVIVKINGKEKKTIDSDYVNGFGEYADLVTIVDRGTTEKRKIELVYSPESVSGGTFMLLGIIE